MLKGVKEAKGVKVESYGEVSIYEGFPYFFYEVEVPKLSEKEEQIYNSLKNAIIGGASLEEARRQTPESISKEFIEEFRSKLIMPITYSSSLAVLINPTEFNALKINLIALLKKFCPEVKNSAYLANRILDDTIGYGIIAPFMRDPNLEEIMVNNFRNQIFVFHKIFGMCKTNVSFEKEKPLNLLIQKIASTADRKFDINNPLLDARLLEGNRANATFPLATPFSPTLTIRKFTRIPLSIVDFIANNTVSSELAAFLWVMAEGMNVEPMNIIITGGAGSGKTTTLNVLATFARYQERIVTIEDALELHLGSRENWIQMEAKPKTKEHDEISMDDLLKNSLRMRPDRIILGEVRGPEAQTLFVAMDTGHRGCMGTLHSNSSKEMLLRLSAEPMAVPTSLISLMDLIVVQYKIYVKGRGIMRRIVQVSEVTSMEKTPLLANLYEWDRNDDKIKRTDIPSNVIERLAQKTLKTKKEVTREINVRKRILEWMLENNIRSSPEVETMIQRYYYDPESLLEKVLSDIDRGR